MKKNFLNIFASIVLLCNLLCTQVITHLFHYHEEEISASSKKSPNTNTSLEKAVAKCKICSLHIIHDLYYSEETIFAFTNTSTSYYQVLSTRTSSQNILFFKGRAPPVFSSLF